MSDQELLEASDSNVTVSNKNATELLRPLSEYASSKWLKNQDFSNGIESIMNEEVVVKGIKEMLLLIKDASTSKDNESSTELPSEEIIYNFDWNAIYEISSKMIEEYSKQIDTIFKELENVNKKLGYWQEAGFSFDAHRGLKFINNHEEWMKLKEKYLSYRQQQLDSTVKEIADSVGRLEKE